MSAPLVSILVPVYNRRTILRQSVESALAQTVRDIEVVIVDNASTDGTWDVCQELARQDSRVRIFQQPINTGPIRNWQRCMAEARAYYAKCVWSDDLISANSLEKTLPYLSDPTVGLVFNAARIFSDQGVGEVLYDHHGDRPGYLSRDEYVRLMLYNQGASVPNSPVASLFRLKDLRESVLLEVPSPIIKDYPDHSMGTDVLAHLLVAQRYERVAYVPEPMTMFRSHPDSITTWALNEASEKWTDSYQQVKIWFTLAHNRTIDLHMLLAQEWWRIFTTRYQGRQADPFITVARRFLEQPEQAGIPNHQGDAMTDARYIRSVFAAFWQSVPDQHLEDIFHGEAGGFYRTALHSKLNEQPLNSEEQALVKQLSATVAKGLDQPGGIQALMAVMLYLAPGSMKVQNAAQRLPAWLLPDYQAIFEMNTETVENAGSVVAPPNSPPPSVAPAPQASVPLYEDMTFLNRLLGCANLYYIDPEERLIADELRLIRQQVGQIWAQTPFEHLEALYRSEFGRRYVALLNSGYQHEPLRPEEESVVQELTGLIGQGIDRYPGLNAFLAAMMYLPPGKMQVRDAANRLPAWLLPDYQRIFEPAAVPVAAGSVPSVAPIASPSLPSPSQPIPQSMPQPNSVPPSPNLALVEDMVFLNRFLGLTNLYEIDPEDQGIIAQLRETRRQVAELWLAVPSDRLEAVFASELGRRYRAYLTVNFAREPLTAEEDQFRQQIAALLGRGVEQPGGANALLAAMMYFAPGTMQVREARSRLPGWLLPVYLETFEPDSAEKKN